MKDEGREEYWRLPEVSVELVEDRAEARGKKSFLRLRRSLLRNRYDDGSYSAAYPYDFVERDAMDAVGIVLWTRRDGELYLCLRSAIRPPLAFRSTYALPLSESTSPAVVWEIPAGLIEPEEAGVAGVRACAAREALEEVGASIDPAAFTLLGPAVTLSPGVIAEKIYFLAAEVDPMRFGIPTEDGSPVEERAKVIVAALSEVERALADGTIADIKTEVGVRRLIAHLSEAASE